MDTKNENNLSVSAEKKNKNPLLPLSILASAIIVAGAWIYNTGLEYGYGGGQARLLPDDGLAVLPLTENSASALKELVLPSDGVVLPVRWDDLGKRMVDAGVINAEKFESIYAARGGLTEGTRELLYGNGNGNLKITAENSGEVLNLLWAFGLANKNPVLENGPMTTYDGNKADSPAEALAKAGRFASTGGWTLSVGNAMEHYSAHTFVSLTADQQSLVERVASGIYRPCCGNSTYFPDCNHGMAMLGLLEIMAAQGASEEEMYRVAFKVNSYWFPDTYLTIAKLLEGSGVSWEGANPQEILGADYSSAQGFQGVLKKIGTVEPQGGGGCGV